MLQLMWLINHHLSCYFLNYYIRVFVGKKIKVVSKNSKISERVAIHALKINRLNINVQ